MRAIKKFRNISIALLIVLVALPGLMLLLLGNNGFQNYLTGKVTRSLSDKLETEVSVGHLQYKLFNRFSLDDFYLLDQNKDTLGIAKNLEASFELKQLLKRKLVFNKVKLDDFHGHLVIDSAGVTNLQFIIDAFSKEPKKKKQKEAIELNFKEINLNNSSFRLTNNRLEEHNESRAFDASHLWFKDINADLSLNYLKKDSLDVTIHNFTTLERSGLKIDNLVTRVTGLKTGFRMSEVKLEMPGSKLHLDSVRMEYDTITDLRDVLNSVRWNAEVRPSKLNLSDLTAFVPNFANIKDPVKLEGHLDGRISSFRTKDLKLEYRNSFRLNADVDMNGLPQIEETFLFADINDLRVNKGDLQDFIAKISNRPFVLPNELTRLGSVKYKGNISGFFSNLVSYGNFVTDVGSLRTDILVQLENKMRDVHYSGSVQSSSFNLGRLLADKTFGKTAFKLSTNGSKLYEKAVQGEVSGKVDEFFLNDYTYSNIELDGIYDGSGFEGSLDINDPNLHADFNGMVDLTQALPIFNFDILVEDADLFALNLSPKYEDAKLSFRGNTNIIGNSLDNLNGFLLLDDIHFQNGEKEFDMELFLLESEMGETSKLSITSDILKADFEGKFKYSTLPASISQFVQNYLPSFSGENVLKKEHSATVANNLISFNIDLGDTRNLSDILELPFILEGNSQLTGVLNDSEDKISLFTRAPLLHMGKSSFSELQLMLDNDGKKLNLGVDGAYLLSNDYIHWEVNATGLGDSISTHVAWHNHDSLLFAGELQAEAKILKQQNLTAAEINFLPTQIVLSDSIWNLNPSLITINPDTTIDVRSFSLQNSAQYILIDGIASKDPLQELNVQLGDVDIGFILKMLQFDALTIDGRASGSVSVSGLLKQPIIESNLFVANTLLNDTPIGNTTIYTGWNPGDSELLISGTADNGGDAVTLASGSYSLSNDSLNFVFDANQLNLGFLEKWLGAVVQDIEGTASGTLRMYGAPKNIIFEGDVYAQDAALSIEYLQTRYSFSDSVFLRKNSIEMRNVEVRDIENNKAVLNGVFAHTGMFQDFTYDFKIRTNNLMGLNTTVHDNDFFYGRAYAAGNVHIHGNEEETNIDVNVSSQPKTKMYISIGGAEEASESNFITFVNPNDTLESPKKKLTEQQNRLNLSLNMDIAPTADIQLIISPESGDMISGNGSGNIRIAMEGEEDVKMFGSYTIERGNFLFTLQNLMRKQFKIEQGSSIAWSGDPMRAQLDIKAIHSLNASLRDLMSEDILRSTDRTIVPVNSVLHLTEDLMQPNIKFDVDLPSSDETLKMQVKNLINTEEMLNRQMIYLLVFGRFYTPEYNRIGTDQAMNTISNFSSLASSLAFGQVNNYLSQLVDNLTFGVNIRNETFGDNMIQQYETAVNYQPNNRLIVNGNFGYRDDNFARNKIIGDLDVEYLLAENSKWRMKFFNHTVDRYSLKSAPFTQGMGVMYREDFNSWGDLFHKFIRRKTDDEPEASAIKQDTPEITSQPAIEADTIPGQQKEEPEQLD